MKFTALIMLLTLQTGLHAQELKTYVVTIVVGKGPVKIESLNTNAAWTKLAAQGLGIDAAGPVHIESIGAVVDISRNDNGIRVDFNIAVISTAKNLRFKVTGAGVPAFTISCRGVTNTPPDAAGNCLIKLDPDTVVD